MKSDPENVNTNTTRGERDIVDINLKAFDKNFFKMGYISLNLIEDNKTIFYMIGVILFGFFILYLLKNLCL